MISTVAQRPVPRAARAAVREGLERGIDAPSPHGMPVVDAMTAAPGWSGPGWSGEQRAGHSEVRRTLLTSAVLTLIELSHGSGVSRRA